MQEDLHRRSRKRIGGLLSRTSTDVKKDDAAYPYTTEAQKVAKILNKALVSMPLYLTLMKIIERRYAPKSAWSELETQVGSHSRSIVTFCDLHNRELKDIGTDVLFFL